jgi:crotonobetainyl-CoA:carnitine CoA-transferase CaiB-like acyl-CoA transferase
MAGALDGVKVVEVAGWLFVDEIPPELTRAPDAGEHTDQILEEELGLDRDAIHRLKAVAIIN